MITSELPPETASQDDIKTPDEAFLSAFTPKHIGEIELNPYSLFRQLIAIDICGEKYGWVSRMIVHVWVCTLDEKQCLAAESDHEKAVVEAMRWAESIGIKYVGSPKMDELTKVYNQIMAELRASTELMAEQTATDSKNDGRLPG